MQWNCSPSGLCAQRVLLVHLAHSYQGPSRRFLCRGSLAMLSPSMLLLIALAIASTVAAVPAVDEHHRRLSESCADTCFGQTCDYWIQKCVPLPLITRGGMCPPCLKVPTSP